MENQKSIEDRLEKLEKWKEDTSSSFWQLRNYEMRSRAKDRGLEFKLTVPQIKELKEGVCIYCGSKDRITIDRKNNTIGYIYDNCVSACFKCNFFKGADISFEEMMMVGEIVKNMRTIRPDFWDSSYITNQKITRTAPQIIENIEKDSRVTVLEQINGFLKNNGGKTYREISIFLGVSLPSVTKNLSLGKSRRMFINQDGKWSLVN